jgi:5-methylphenazine-1-carboxylate 1-monooxygenase
MDVVIIGGGIGGLTAALALHDAGIKSRVFEATSEYKSAGVGINLHAHAVRELARVGLEPALCAGGIAAKEFSFFTQHGQLVHTDACGRFAGGEHAHIAIHRAKLQDILKDAVIERLGPDAIVMDHRCIGIDADGASATFDVSGAQTTVHADALIGCDGFNSTMRKLLHRDEPPSIDTRKVAWRGTVQAQPFLSGATIILMGQYDTAMVTAYPVQNHPDGTQLLSVTAITPSQGEPDEQVRDAVAGEFIDHFADWRFDWIDIPALFSKASLKRHPMREREPVDRWTFGRTTLLGDAAHPMSPRGGNGAAQALIDATVLAQCLSGTTDVAAALATYEEQRRPQAYKVVLMNRQSPPDTVIKRVNEATGGRPFDNLDAIVDRGDLQRITTDYRKITGAR